MRGVIFRSALRYLKFKPADGLRVVARGRVSVYEPKGEYQLVCEHMEPHGLGALQLAFDQLKKRLQEEGLFDAARKRPLPALPRKIGIVTSLEGAAIRDIIKVLSRRYANAHLVIRPARVQGDGAALDIARGLRAHRTAAGRRRHHRWTRRRIDRRSLGVQRGNRRARDCGIAGTGHLGRRSRNGRDHRRLRRRPARADAVGGRRNGGGSQGRVPGADRSAGRSARRDGARADPRPQPQRPHAQRAAGALRRAWSRRDAGPARGGAHARAGARAARRPHAPSSTRCSNCAGSSTRSIQDDVSGGIRARLVTADSRLAAATTRAHHRADARFRACASRLDTLSPLAVLGRGYAVCWTADGARILRASTDVDVGDSVRVTLATASSTARSAHDDVNCGELVARMRGARRATPRERPTAATW